ncbi:hypothetical protein FA95DRAFT_1598433 [Auriscalpium vulgare]|uniref:Uncharacterized protein n=1 Tax=Auriscalpium vulgare TaxID=40419 RepID=A0ACB8REL4_9AGAM|nr:hypothetical protein FA95DRAFT_1598433 [Auriscalpium vulgare]
MDALLRVSPSKVIKAARDGSYPAIKALSRSPGVVPDSHKAEVVVLFCAHIRKTPIVPRKYDYIIGQCFYGLSILIQAPPALQIPDVTDTWPAMTKWYTHFSQELAQGNQGLQAALDSYMHIIHLFVYDSKMRDHVLATPDAIKCATLTWLGAEMNGMPLVASPPNAAITVAQLLIHAPAPVIDTINSSGASVHDVATRIVHPLRIALAAHPPPIQTFFDAHVWLLEQTIFAPEAARFIPAILSAGAVRCLSRTLLRFSRAHGHEAPSPDFIIAHCLCTLLPLLHMGTGIPWIAQSVRHGLLEALVNIAPHLHTHEQGVQEICTRIVKSTLPPYLFFRPVIKAVGKAFQRLEDGPNIALAESRAFVDSWTYLRHFGEECVRFRANWSSIICSHAAHWKMSHKARCAQRLGDIVQLSGIVSVHEQQFHVAWVRYNAAALAASIVALILAPDASPDRTQYLQSLVIVLNFSLVPWELGMRRMGEGEWEATRTDASSWVFMESVVVLRRTEARARTSMPHAVLAHFDPTMIDYVIDRIPVEYGGRGIYAIL